MCQFCIETAIAAAASTRYDQDHDHATNTNVDVPVGFPLLRRAAWFKRLHARLLAKGNKTYDEAMAPRKQALFGELTGTVLEIGAGSGANLGFLRRDVRWIGIEPNPFAHDYLRERTAALDLHAELHVAPAERLPVPDASVDAVICSLVLCTVNDVAGTLSEVRRVLKPGGRFAFLEHVIGAPGTHERRVQRALRGPWMVIGDGCRPDRDTAAAIRAAGFRSFDVSHWDAPLPAIVRPHLSGVAIR